MAVKGSNVEMPDVTRVVVIDHSPDGSGIAWQKLNLKDVMVSVQDGGRTLKVFVK